jgi:hypothetical protein
MIEAARALPLEDQRRLREWLEEQEQREAEQQKRQEAVRQQVEKYQQAMNWIREHRDEYLGQWVALDGDRLVSHGTDGKQVYAQARAAGVEVPLLEHVVEITNDQPRPETPQPDHERSRQARQWLDVNRRHYLGQWVALDGDRLISHGTDGRLVMAQVKAAGVRQPFIELVSQESEPFCGGWLP